MKSREDVLKLIVKFARTDLKKLRPGDHLNLEDDLRNIVWNREPGDFSPSFAFGEHDDWMNPLSDEVMDPRRLEVLARMQAYCLELLESIPQDAYAHEIPPKEIKIRFGIRWQSGPKATIYGRTQDLFLLRIFLLLSGDGMAKIKRCDECSGFYYREHAAQRCCSKKCAGRIYMRYYRKEQSRSGKKRTRNLSTK